MAELPYRLEVKGLSFKAAIDTFLATLCSGYTFFLMLKVLILTGMELSGLRARGTAALSGGQKQRVCIAAVVALQPDILVLDEPTSELDPLGSRQVFETLGRLNRELGITVIIVEQKVMLLAEYCSRIAVMEVGKIVLDGDTNTVLRHYKKLKELGINCPRVVELAALLEEAGLHVGADCRAGAVFGEKRRGWLWRRL